MRLARHDTQGDCSHVQWTDDPGCSVRRQSSPHDGKQISPLKKSPEVIMLCSMHAQPTWGELQILNRGSFVDTVAQFPGSSFAPNL